jgi:hypothetical protein
MYLDRVIARLVEQGVDLKEFKPCTEQEVQELEQQLERRLPAAYREFLLTMGHGAGEVFQSDDCFYEDLPKIQRLATILLKPSDATLPDDAFVFLYAGYQFLFFRTSEGDDPPAYYYMEGDDMSSGFQQQYKHYTDFLMLAIEEHV